jgi:Protein of unknown function (DUF3750)
MDGARDGADTAVPLAPRRSVAVAATEWLMRWPRRILTALAVLLAGPFFMVACGGVHLDRDWRTADRSSSGQAPDPAHEHAAVVQVYAARAFNWRGIFAVHTWIATKRAGARHYVVYQVLGWNVFRGLPAVTERHDLPDRNWFGNRPVVVNDVRGAKAAALIPQIERAVADYPYQHSYTLWPGPNSNTFTAWVGRRVPALHMDLPSTAIGKDYVPGGLVDRAPSGGGVQVSLFGLLGVLVAPTEGLEINVLGLSFGVDLLPPAIKLPGFGRVGFGSRPSTRPAACDGTTS